jgi:hypothetical protein
MRTHLHGQRKLHFCYFLQRQLAHASPYNYHAGQDWDTIQNYLFFRVLVFRFFFLVFSPGQLVLRSEVLRGELYGLGFILSPYLGRCPRCTTQVLSLQAQSGDSVVEPRSRGFLPGRQTGKGQGF